MSNSTDHLNDALDMCREKDQRIAELEAENSTLRQAIGLATTAVPNMEMDVSDPSE